MTSALPQDRGLPVALFLVALSTVMFEILLTRVFSLTLWYHFAFMAISIAMFGMTAGALLVFLKPWAWPEATLRAAMGKSAVLFAVSMPSALFLHIYLFLPNPYALPLVWTFLSTAVPFAFSGVFVCLALTRFPSRMGHLYAADLAGAAIGCLCVIVALSWLDGLGAALGCAAVAAAAGTLLLRGRARIVAVLIGAALAGSTLWAAVHLAREEVAAFPIPYVKGMEQEEFDYERWNSFSRITVMKPNVSVTAWSLSASYTAPLSVPNRWLHIDAGAGTQLIGFDGDLAKVEFLRWDLPNFAHHLRRDARVCIVGAGGGRDLLTAMLFGQKRIVAVEINPNIIKVVNERFGDYTGHLDRDARVTLVTDEARSYLARAAKERCDILQLTFIDTWAATAAGAYVLTENTLYTIEGWQVFLGRLEDNGLLAVARGVGPELARLVALGREALRASGVAQPERHMMLVTNQKARPPRSFGRMGLLLLRKTPFPADEVAQIRALAAQMQFEVEVEPDGAKSPFLRALATGHGIEKNKPPESLNYSAPSDDRPFFFNLQRFSTETMLQGFSHPVGLLMNLLAGVVVLSLICIVLPLALSGIALARADGAFLCFFAAIGAGFMLIEISMLQRLIVFLGHPAYSLSVILFVLLLASGFGSWISARVPDDRVARRGEWVLIVLAAVLAAVGAATGPLIALFEAAETPLRIAVSSALLASMGIFMGMAFPLGMRLAMASRAPLGPWLWGVNGAMSVLASVLAVVLAMTYGISASFWTGVASYLVALGAFALAARQRSPAGP